MKLKTLLTTKIPVTNMLKFP